MKNNKLLMIMMIILVAITLVGAVALVVVLKFTNNENKEPTIEEVLEASVDVPEITTNLKSDDFIRISFKITTDSKKAKEELAKRDFQVKNLIIQELSEMTAEQLKGKEGKQKLEDTLKGKVNSLMQEGKIDKVYITSSILQ